MTSQKALLKELIEAAHRYRRASECLLEAAAVLRGDGVKPHQPEKVTEKAAPDPKAPTCDLCGRTFGSKQGLGTHMTRAHKKKGGKRKTLSRPVTCPSCGYETARDPCSKCNVKLPLAP